MLADLHARANAPVFAALSVYLGAGIVGGPLMSIDEAALTAADTAVRLLNGAAPASIQLPPQLPAPPIFDWRELERWRISESRLPPGSAVRYRPPSLWQAHKVAVLCGVGVVAVQALLIVGLVYQRRARQRAEGDSRRNLALAADVSRRETMSALTARSDTSSVNRSGRSVYNARALQTMVTGNRATPDVMAEILSDIQTQSVRATEIIDRHWTLLKSHQLDKTPIDSKRRHRRYRCPGGARDDHTAGLHYGHSVVESCVVDGDPVLLQQVLVNLVMNAADAMAETTQSRRHVTIAASVLTADVDVSVRDTGPGVPAEILESLFTPFVTTKARGLGIGLTIVRSIVDAHSGTIAARNNPEGARRLR